MNPLHHYLQELQAVRASGAGVKETSYYPAVSGLFNAVGKTLKPSVRCIINLKNTGAGIPDGGFFTPDQVGSGVPSPRGEGGPGSGSGVPSPVPSPLRGEGGQMRRGVRFGRPEPEPEPEEARAFSNSLFI